MMIEPYQPGKIPVIFIHGLASSPLAWLDAANELEAQPDLYRRFQFWAFNIRPAAGCWNRRRPCAANCGGEGRIRSATPDPALDDMVIVGHSMGGLMAKLQITDSENILWRHLANGPLDAVRTTPEIRDVLARTFFFDPVPSVKRVVFAGTPFQGSSLASRAFGRVFSNLIHFSGPENDEYRQLMQANRDVFSPYLWRKQPTSIDILEPSSPILAALQEMPVNPSVTMHTIIGTGWPRPLREPSDGVVAVSSASSRARRANCTFRPCTWDCTIAPETIVELIRILRLHAEETQAAGVVDDHRTGTAGVRK